MRDKRDTKQKRVVVENIYTHMARGQSRREAFIESLADLTFLTLQKTRARVSNVQTLRIIRGRLF
jgi:hypothetical protein